MPRPQPTRHDKTALRILEATAELIDASLSDTDTDLPPRLRSIRFPAALEWIRVEDVARVAAAYRPAISKKAILNRWPTKEELVRDAAIHCILYGDLPEGGTPDITPETMVVTAGAVGLAETIRYSAETILANLLERPRSFLLMHLAPMLPRHPLIQRQIAVDAARIQLEWAEGYRSLMNDFGVILRPEWTPERLSLCLQMLLDGHMVRHRVDAAYLATHCRPKSTLFADAVLALIAGAVDTDSSGLTAASLIDRTVKSSN